MTDQLMIKDFGQWGVVQDISKPLLSYSWSSKFSFSKCHLDTNVPYDNFVTQFLDTEDFTRYVRMFTRGYDVYTPTTNIVYRDYHGANADRTLTSVYNHWNHDEIERKDSIERVHTILELDNRKKRQHQQEQERSNLGIYGIGKLRSLKQLETFTGIDLKQMLGHSMNKIPTCANLRWEPYEPQDQVILPSDLRLLPVSPMDNLYNQSNDLDPQPEFPNRKVSRRTLSSYYNDQQSTLRPFWHLNDSIIFCLLLLFLLTMKKLFDRENHEDEANEECGKFDLLYLLIGEKKQKRRRKARNAKKVM